MVRDTGPGIPANQLDKIFDRFYQVENGWKKENSGTGIGLSLAKELTSLLHGEIHVESYPPEGCCFRVKIPVGKDHLKKHEYVITEQDETDGQSMNIKCSLSLSHYQETDDSYEVTGTVDMPVVLIVDDNPDIRRHIRESFSGDFTIKEASNGNEGLEKALVLIPDLVITDLVMPDTDGLEFCRKLKTDVRISHVPVIMLTARADIQDKIAGLETGADDYVTKPFNNKELLARAKNLIGQRRSLREQYNRQISMEPEELAVKSVDENFLERVRKVIEKNISDCDFDVNSFCPEIGMSRMQLSRKLKALVNQTPGELIRNLRLQRASQLIRQNYGNVAEVAYEVGFNNLSYFAKCFRDKFGILPSEYQKHAVG